MRKINKSPNIPQSLLVAPVPTNKADVKVAIYKADDVRKQLCEDQYYKCAYCECDLTKSFNDVEHYRPKSKYYWLGHEWSNLLYSCDLCNRTYKNHSFPLIDENNRVKTPGDLSREEPLIINPADIDPLDHIKYDRWMMNHKTQKGKKTIELFHLNNRLKRPELINKREQVYEEYKTELDKLKFAQMILQNKGCPQDVRDKAIEIVRLCNLSINKLKSPSRAYSGMLISQI